MALITPERALMALRKTPVLLKGLLNGVSQEQAQQATDGPGGWSVVETMGHLRDLGEVSLVRARRILEEEDPVLPNFDPLDYARRRDTARQPLAAEFAAFLDSRKELLALLSGLSEAQWQRRGTHAKYGPLTLLELAVFIALHDVDHFEQIARTLGLSDALL